MSNKKKEIKLYNVLFPVWMIMMLPPAWLIVIPGNFAIDSLVLLLGMKIFQIADRKLFYKKHIVKIFLFGMLSDVIGTIFMFALLAGFEVGSMGDEPYITIPALIIAAVCIYFFNYRFTFKDVDPQLRKKLALLFAVVTAPYTFLIPSSLIY